MREYNKGWNDALVAVMKWSFSRGSCWGHLENMQKALKKEEEG